MNISWGSALASVAWAQSGQASSSSSSTALPASPGGKRRLRAAPKPKALTKRTGPTVKRTIAKRPARRLADTSAALRASPRGTGSKQTSCAEPSRARTRTHPLPQPLSLGSMCSGICVDADALHNITGTYKHSFVAENNPNAVHYLRDNFHIDRYYLDATSEDFADTAPCTSIFVSGFPCQPFSNMGTNKGLADSRGQVIVHVLRHIRTRLPRIAVLENVPGLRFRHPQVLVWILEELNAIRDESGEPAYSVFWNILDALDYGLPQRRQRLFIVSILRLGRASVPFSWPTPVPCLPLHHIYDKDARPLASYDAYPLPPACHGHFPQRRVEDIVGHLRAPGIRDLSAVGQRGAWVFV